MPSSQTQNYMFKAVCETPDLKAFIAASRSRIMRYAMENKIGNGNVGLLLQEISNFKAKLLQCEKSLLQQWRQASSLDLTQSDILNEFDTVNRSRVAQEERLAGQEPVNSVLATLLNKDAGLSARSRWIDHVELDMLSALSQTNIHLECTNRQTLGRSSHDITGSLIIVRGGACLAPRTNSCILRDTALPEYVPAG